MLISRQRPAESTLFPVESRLSCLSNRLSFDSDQMIPSEAPPPLLDSFGISVSGSASLCHRFLSGIPVRNSVPHPRCPSGISVLKLRFLLLDSLRESRFGTPFLTLDALQASRLRSFASFSSIPCGNPGSELRSSPSMPFRHLGLENPFRTRDAALARDQCHGLPEGSPEGLEHRLAPVVVRPP